MPRDSMRRVGAGFGAMSETKFGALIPVLLALVAIWVFFGLTEPAFLSPRNFYFLFMQSAVVGTIASASRSSC